MAAKIDCRGTIQERLWSRFIRDEQTGCWDWTGAISNKSYGSIYYEGRMQKAHRVMWRLERGEIPSGLELDHLCRNRRCINPDHLEPVTRRENLARGIQTNQNAGKLVCIRGHAFTEKNTRTRPNGERTCIACMDMHRRNWRAKNAIAS